MRMSSQIQKNIEFYEPFRNAHPVIHAIKLAADIPPGDRRKKGRPPETTSGRLPMESLNESALDGFAGDALRFGERLGHILKDFQERFLFFLRDLVQNVAHHVGQIDFKLFADLLA